VNVAPLLAGLVIALFVAPPAGASAQLLDTEGERFRAEVVQVYGAPDADRIRALLHPKSAACLRAEPKYERYLMRAETMQPLPHGATVSVHAVAANARLPYAGFDFPVRPSHLLRMEYGRTTSPDGRETTTQIADKYIARDDGKWYVILPCATPTGLRRLGEMGLLD
jgi:hypothetical protein